MLSIFWYRNVGNYQCTLHNIPEDRRSHLHRGGSLQSRKTEVLFASHFSTRHYKSAHAASFSCTTKLLTCHNISFSTTQQPLVGQGLLIIEASRLHSDTPHSFGLLWTSNSPSQIPLPENTQHSHRQPPMPPAGFEPATQTSDGPQTHALYRPPWGLTHKIQTYSTLPRLQKKTNRNFNKLI